MQRTIILSLISLFVIIALPASSLAMYNTEQGRFMQRDPLGERDGICLINFTKTGAPVFSRNLLSRFQYKDGMNLYEYVKSNSIKQTDPTGQFSSLMLGLASTQVCCMLKTTTNKAPRTIYMGMAMHPYKLLPSQITCSQSGILNIQGLTPAAACRCAFEKSKGSVDVKVVGAYRGPCKWCTVTWYQSFIAHAMIKVKCGNITRWIESYPWATNSENTYEDAVVGSFSYFDIGPAVTWPIYSITVPERVALNVIINTKPGDWTWAPIAPLCENTGNCIGYFMKKWPEFSEWCK